MKKKLLSLLIGLFSIFAISHSWANSISNENNSNLVAACEAPPPDSLRVTVKGTHFITLEWKAAFEGAEHYLEVYTQTEDDVWELYQTYESVLASSKTVNNLLPGKRYRFKIATKCGAQDPSIFSVYIDEIILILELTLNGRMPIEPQVKNDCDPLEYLDPKNDWVGYRVTHQREGLLLRNYFEFVSSEENGGEGAQLRRVATFHPIVAADTEGKYPEIQEPSVPLDNEEYVNMGTVEANLLNSFGFVDILLEYYPISVKICKVLGGSWDESFIFEPMTATKTQGVIPNNRFAQQTPQFQISNPIKDAIKIQAPESYGTDAELYHVHIINLNGNILQSYFNLFGNTELNSGQLPPGIYYLCFETAQSVSFVKAIKIF